MSKQLAEQLQAAHKNAHRYIAVHWNDGGLVARVKNKPINPEFIVSFSMQYDPSEAELRTSFGSTPGVTTNGGTLFYGGIPLRFSEYDSHESGW